MAISEMWEVTSSLWGYISPWMVPLLKSLAVLAAFWLGSVAAERLIRRLGHARSIDASLTRLLGRVAKVGLLLFGAVTALGTLGVDVSALVAGLGLTGFALGFALKDIISNVLAGILVIIYKPFRPGDEIIIAAFQGTVKEIDLRYTTLEAQGKKIFVPNAMVFSNAVTVAPA
jgi:small conductance mechanosensitive channel